MRAPLAALLVLGCLCHSGVPLSAQQGAGALHGHVQDAIGLPLPGVTVVVRAPGADAAVTTVSGARGAYRIDDLSPGRHEVAFHLPNFGALRREVEIAAGIELRLDATLALTMSADVAVTGKRTFRNLGDLDRVDGSLVGLADAASEGLVTGRQIDARPIMRAGEVLETVPGLVISQHSGEGKANQYYLRGFNLDHGTDFATTVAGVPVNMPTHAHGHGYSDLNFLIPEIISGVQFRKGPYYADEGDFSAAGAAHIRYANSLDAPLVRLSVGEDGWRRMVVAASPRAGRGHLLVAGEVTLNDGPWVRADHYQRLNGVVRYSVGDGLNAWSITAMAYDGSWKATDQAPTRAIATGAISRLDSIDDTSGGDTRRLSLSTDWQRTTHGGVTRLNAYVMGYALDLYSNFTYFLDDPVDGDQFQQSDRRVVAGGRVSRRVASLLGGRAAEVVFGADVRVDGIDRVALIRTARRMPRSAVRDDAVGQASVAGYLQHEVQWTPWVRSSAGLRVDAFSFHVEARQPGNSGSSGAALASPKASLIVGPFRGAELYLNGGFGYHSNDARGTTITVDPASGDAVDRVTPLVQARGAEIGARFTPMAGLGTDVALWRLDLDSELLFVGDAGTTASGRPSRREGIEWNTYYSPRPWLTVDADLAWSRSRFTDGHAAGQRIPGAVERVVSAGLSVDDGRRGFGSVRLRALGARNLVEDGRVRSRPTRLLNGQVGLRVGPRTEVVVDGFNLLDARATDVDYYYRSRLPGEPAAGVEDVHTHPALPRTLRLSLRWRF